MKTHSKGSSNQALISGSSASMDPACSNRSSAPSGAMAFEPSQQQLTLVFSSAAGVTTCPNSQDVTAQDVRDAYVSSKTQRAYKGSIPVIARWIRSSKGEEASRYVSAEGEIDIVQFLARDFEEVLMEQRKNITGAALSGYRRAIKDLYRHREVALPAAYEKGMTIYISGLKRMQASRLQSGSEGPATVLALPDTGQSNINPPRWCFCSQVSHNPVELNVSLSAQCKHCALST
ncbi:hypothetical protein JG687_00016837 [Phytophthora cactorum]|uniref:Core-binding (CB) domain-containing protein n=1 Tax=Phytophthora cactorum TaxID=29920 RepID=A0A8T1TPY8_9STRA|nr:hypothetical protein PC120_g26356 [Phytophthora cactorum]KAG3048171.1 hypothetical protein PC121_g19639 [Phytophthora cactorum]KAG4043944.1 hypothetical protein PC123_g20600 [Phytophthora cactorum]KAG6946212.1 hypothetical protein JG687_00016837 [Phytophthora cactorum]